MSKDEATKEILSADELDKWIKTIRINKANLEWISETGEINGSLLVELRRVIPLINESYYQSKLNKVTNDNQISDLIYNENSPDLTEFECEKLQDIIIEHLKKN